MHRFLDDRRYLLGRSNRMAIELVFLQKNLRKTKSVSAMKAPKPFWITIVLKFCNSYRNDERGEIFTPICEYVLFIVRYDNPVMNACVRSDVLINELVTVSDKTSFPDHGTSDSRSKEPS